MIQSVVRKKLRPERQPLVVVFLSSALYVLCVCVGLWGCGEGDDDGGGVTVAKKVRVCGQKDVKNLSATFQPTRIRQVRGGAALEGGGSRKKKGEESARGGEEKVRRARGSYKWLCQIMAG